MWKIGWGISNQCNMACKFCYSKNIRNKETRLYLDEGISFVEQNANNIESINFGTGEPTVVPDFFKLCAKLKKIAPNIKLGITTNGTLASAVKDPYNLFVFDRYITDIDISLDYCDANAQDKSRNYTGAFENAIETLKLCQKYHKNATVVSVMHRFNGFLDNIEGMLRIARLFGASYRINILRPIVDFEFVLPYILLKHVYTHLIYRYKVESIADPLLASLVNIDCKQGDPTAKSSFRILPNGYITPSTYLLDSYWQSKRLDEIGSVDELHTNARFLEISNIELPEACSICTKKNNCHGGVIDRRWLWYQDFTQNDPYCPLRFGDTVDWMTLSDNVIFSDKRKSFVHDGYLPTLIFNPVVNQRAEKIWDKIYLSSNDYTSQDPDDIIRVFNDNFLTNKPMNILDLGSGEGRNTRNMISKTNHVTFVDSSYVANDRLLLYLLGHNIYYGYTILENDITDYLKENDKQFDLIIVMHILSHGNPDSISDIIKNIYRCLTGGGYCVITLPSISDKRCPNHEKDVFSYILNSGPEIGIEHSFFSEKSVRKLLASFKIHHLKEDKYHWKIIIEKPIRVE
jgi:radical SAM protein with 4Fe4S-binding SPASM domain